MTNARILLLVSDRVVRSVIGRTAQAIHTILAAVGMKHNTFFRGRRFLMVAKYDIFKKINESIVWVEAVEDIVAVKKRLMSLTSTGTDDYRV